MFSWRRLLIDTEAATSVEYALVVALVIAVAASVTILGIETNNSFSKSNQNLTTHGMGS